MSTALLVPLLLASNYNIVTFENPTSGTTVTGKCEVTPPHAR